MASATTAGRELMKTGIGTFLMETIAVSSIIKPAIIEREVIDKTGIEELAENIKQAGLINPITVKKVNGKYEIVAGHRRYLAIKLLGITKLQVKVINEGKGYSEIIKLSENLLREDLNDYEEAKMLVLMKNLMKANDKVVGKAIGKSEAYVRQKTGIMKYPEMLRGALQRGVINFSVARELARLKNENLMREYLKHAINSGATPALVEAWVDDVIRAEKLEKGIGVNTSKGKAGLQVAGAVFICSVCEGKTDITKSQLFRVCVDCQTKVGLGG